MEATPNIFVSFAAGLLSFLSPCILPLIPSYISFIGGATLEELKEGETNRWVVLKRTLFFVLGFSVVFIALGVILSGGSILLGGWSLVINVIAGSIVILLGLNFIFDFWKILNIEKRFQIRQRPSSSAGSFVVGMAFGGGWSPCIGPILAAILFLSSQSDQLFTSILYLVVYSLGLGLPFVLAAVFFSAFARNVKKIARHARTIKTVSGVLLIAIGVSIAFGRFQLINSFFFSAAYDLQRWTELNPTASRVLFGLSTLAIGLVSLIPLGKRVLGSSKKAHVNADTEKRTPVFTAALGGALVVVAILELTHVIYLEGLIAAWLSFQGL